jgi:ribose transport system ATP-binding protein
MKIELPHPVLRVRGVHKAFAATQALAGVSVDLQRHSIHALVGGNGSGKSTLIKILAGVYPGDAGTIEIRGTKIDARAMSPARAREAGLHFVHQQQSTFIDLSVADNLAIGHGFIQTKYGRVRWTKTHRRTREILERFHIDASPTARLGDLSPASQTMVAIARALQDQEGRSDGVLILDEPTASLPRSEVDLLLRALRRYADAGQTILYVTHRLDEVFQVADRTTVFRDGRVAATAEQATLRHDSLVELIMGRKIELALVRGSQHTRTGRELIRAEGLRGGPIQDASFVAHQGEIVGIAGLLGSGRSSILRMIFGATPIEGGSLTIAGRQQSFGSPRDAIDSGVTYVPEDRLVDAAFPTMTVAENLNLATTSDYFERGRLRHRAERRDAATLVERYLVKASSLNALFTSISGGNQQKIVLARWMRVNPRVLLLDEPTQGVDVGARAEIWHLVRRAVDDDAVALVVSSDMEELTRVCDRVVVLRDRRIVADVPAEDLSEDRIDHLLFAADLPS